MSATVPNLINAISLDGRINELGNEFSLQILEYIVETSVMRTSK